MSQRWPYVVLSGIGIAAMSVLLVPLLREKEPVYQGQPLSYWSIQARLPNGDRGWASRALRAMGPDAVPFLLRELRAQDAPSVRAHRALWHLLPSTLRKKLPQPRPRDDSLFWWTGTSMALAGATMSQVLSALNESNPEVRLAGIWTLPEVSAHWRLQGTNFQAEPVIAVLRRLLKDSSPDIRASAALLLGQIAPRPTEVLPALIGGLQGGGLRPAVLSTLQFQAPDVLGSMGPSAQAAVPELKKLLSHPRSLARVPAAIALWRIHLDTNSVPILTAELNNARANRSPEGAWMCTTILTAFEAMGPAARPAEPAIRQLMESPRRSWGEVHRTNIIAKAREVLKRIDSGAETALKTTLP